MKVVELVQIKKSLIEWYFTEAFLTSGETLYFYKNEDTDYVSSITIIDVIKETKDYYYIIAEL